MDAILTDLRSGFRILTKSPGPAAAAILVLALGIGLSTAMFSIVNGVMYRQLPFEDGHRLYHLEKAHARGMRFVEPRDYLEWRAQQTSFEELSAFAMENIVLSHGQAAERYAGAAISADAFHQLRVRPQLGRLFTAADDRPGAEPVALLGHRVWHEQFGGDPAAVGSPVLIDGRPATVVGVLPEGFRFPLFQDVWIPLRADPTREDWGEGLFLEVFGHLRDGVSVDEARLEMGLVGQRLAAARPEGNPSTGIVVKPYHLAFAEGPERGLAVVSLGAVAFVLAIACANVANLLLARAAARAKELAVRSALGASRLRVIGQMLAESFCLSLPAAAVGLALAGFGVNYFNSSVAGARWPYWADVRIDSASLAVVLALMGLSTLASGLLPALRASRIDAQAVLKSESRGSGLAIGRMSSGLVVAEVALSCVLLIGGGLLLRSIFYLVSIDFEFQTERVLTARLDLLDVSYPDGESRTRFWERLGDELGGRPGIERVAFTSLVPGAYGSGPQSYENADKAYADEKDRPWARYAVVSPGYFETVGVELAEGRDFTRRDDASSAGVVIVNRSLAEREWPGSSALGKRLRVSRADGGTDTLTVIGVAPDLHMDGFRNRTPAGMYFPLAQKPQRSMAITARTSGEPMAAVGALRASVRDVDSALALYAVESLERRLWNETFFYRVIATIFSIFGLAALVLAAIGLYGVMAFSVSRRTAEVGVRMALGAATRDVLRLVVGHGLRQIAVGVVLGMLVAAAVTRLLARQLVGVGTLDPPTFAAIAALLVGAGVAASLVPALRAMKVDPVRALRYE